MCTGATIVQYRDKHSDTGVLIETAKKLKTLCEKKVPLIINDRVDVALASNADGVHLGQDDMDVARARKILGPNKIIGASVSNEDEALVAIAKGADYLGVGTLFATTTKDSKHIIGISGARKILQHLDGAKEKDVPIVCIGGITDANIQRIKFQLSVPKSGASMTDSTSDFSKSIDGVAVVSNIMAADDPKAQAEKLLSLWKEDAPFAPRAPDTCDTELVPAAWNQAVVQVATKKPLSHNMTNTVVQNFAANVCTAVGASPIMSNNGDEAKGLAALQGGLLINMGTATPAIIQEQLKTIAAYNAVGNPIVLDPVGAGATTTRTQQLNQIMGNGYFHVIKGNVSEIIAVARASGYEIEASGQRGVDSGETGLSREQKAYMVSTLAERERNIVLMTGAADYISDGTYTYEISNGHEYLSEITGSGCVLGTIISAYLAANREEDRLEVAIAAILHFEIAAENAAAQSHVHGPGSFVPAFVDELYKIRKASAEGHAWLADRAKVDLVDVKGYAQPDFMPLKL